MPRDAMHFFAILLASTVTAILYGTLHNQVTVTISPTFFTHELLGRLPHGSLGADSPRMLAALWGITTTWWVGLAGGVPLAIAARAGGRARLRVQECLVPLALAAVATGLAASASGLAMVRAGAPAARVAGAMHNTSYCAGAACALLAAFGVAIRRVVDLEDCQGRVTYLQLKSKVQADSLGTATPA